MSKRHLILIIIVLLFFSSAISSQEFASSGAVISYNGIEFRYMPEIFGAVLPAYDAGTPYQVDAPYFANIAPHVSFKFMRQNPYRPDTNLVGELYVYRIADIEAYAEPSYQGVVEQLRNLNTDDLSSYVTVSANYTTPTLPFMPVLNATQVFRAHPGVFNAANVAGIEYYTYYSQSAEPIVEGQVMYTYQGITTDGLYYISFSMPVETGLLQGIIPADFDWETFGANYTQYLSDTFTAINNADPLTFNPNHEVLTRFIESISIVQ